MIDQTERKRLSELPAAEQPAAIQSEIDRIHRSVNTGTTNRDVVNDACERIHLMVNGGKVRTTSKPSKPIANVPHTFGSLPPQPAPPVAPR